MISRRRRSDRRDVRPREVVDFSTEMAQLLRHGAQKHKLRIRSDDLALVADLLDVLRTRRCHGEKEREKSDREKEREDEGKGERHRKTETERERERDKE